MAKIILTKKLVISYTRSFKKKLKHKYKHNLNFICEL